MAPHLLVLLLLPPPGQESQPAEEAQRTGARDYGYQSDRPSHVWAFTCRIVPQLDSERAVLVEPGLRRQQSHSRLGLDGITYTYDAESRRVQKSGIGNYLFDLVVAAFAYARR